MVFVKVILISCLIVVFIQDYKARHVYWFLFPIIGACCGILYYNNTLPELFYNAVAMNLVFVSVLLIAIKIYTRFKLKIKFKEAIGLGDLLLFFSLALSFSTVTCIVVFVSALFFSLVLHLFLSRKEIESTVPLAGYMSLFYSITYLVYWKGIINSVYII